MTEMTTPIGSEACGCCQPVGGVTLAPTVPHADRNLSIDNRPGLSAIVYRAGTYGSFRRALLEAITGTPELAALKTRLSDDYAITLFELWSTVADVLTFYQERIANEGYLRTARFRDSLIRMARLIDYRLGPGVAATVELALTVDDSAPLEDGKIEIPVGLKVQSVPGQDEKPQKFETIETFTAETRWNRLRLVPEPQALTTLVGATEAYLAPGEAALEATAELAPGDRFVRFHSGTADPIEELEIEEVRGAADRMILAWSPPIQNTTLAPTAEAYKLGRAFRLFGYDAPPTYMEPSVNPNVVGKIEWQLKTTVHAYSTAPVDQLTLDRRYQEIAAGAELLVRVDDSQSGQVISTRVTVTEVTETPTTVGPMNDVVTRVTITPPIQLDAAPRVWIHELDGPRIPFWGYTYPESLETSAVYLPGRVVDAQRFEVGREIDRGVLQPGVEFDPDEIDLGRRVLLQGGEQTMAATIGAASVVWAGGEDYLRLELESDTDALLETATAGLLGNVARASHGETVKEEILGDGDASTVFQNFELKKKPLTYLPSSGPGGLESSLHVLVNRALWQETRNLYGRSSDDSVYTTRIADDSTVSVGFGDGKSGARLFSGRGNVTAVYRHGTGLDGRVRADSLTTLLDRPVGLRSATNPRPAEGGADPESLDDARDNAPTTVRTFSRAVSLRDFEDLVQESGEVAKALATWVGSSDGKVVHLTVAGQEAATFGPEALSRIHASLSTQRDPNRGLRVDNFARVPVVVTATLHVAADRVALDIEAAAREALETALSFDALRFGQPLHASDVYQVLQEVNGVEWLTLELFQFKDQTPAFLASRGADNDPVQERLRVYPARPAGFAVLPAEQAWLETPEIDLNLLTSGGLPV